MASREPLAAVLRWLARPARDYLGALEVVSAGQPPSRMLWTLLSAVAAYWVYVPLHELLHVAGCLSSGGSVTRLDLDPKYGAALLQRAFPFIVSGSEYAGRLSGFDTRGSDLIYLATDAAPFVLTPLVGMPLLVWVATCGRGRPTDAARFGASLPFAFAPLLSVCGDYYEMASIVVSRAVHALRPSFALSRIRGDDVTKVLAEIDKRGGADGLDVAALAACFAVEIGLVVVTMALASELSHRGLRLAALWRSDRVDIRRGGAAS